MGTLVDDLFLLAQLDHERPLRIEPVDLADLVRAVGGRHRGQRPRSTVDVDAVDAVVIDGDEHRMRQVVDNLLVNAVDHTPGRRGHRGTACRRGRVGRHHRPRRRTGHRPDRRHPDLPAVLPVRPVAVPGVRRCRASGWPSWPPSWRPITGRSGSFPDRGPPSRCGSRKRSPTRSTVEDAWSTPSVKWSRRIQLGSRRSARSAGSGDSGRDVADRPLDDLARPDARRADVEPPGRPVHQGPDPLDVRIPAPLGPPVGVADVHAERRLLATHLAHRCHDAPTSFQILR